MERVPGTQKTELEKIQDEIEVEARRWNEIGMRSSGIRHDPESIWILKLQVQAMMNVILEKELATAEEINIQFKTLMLNDMRLYREQAELQRRESLVPEMTLLDPNGKPFKI